MNAVDVLLSAEDPELAHLAQLKLSEEKLNILTKLDSEVLDLTADDDVEDEIQEADEFKDPVYGAIIRLDNCTRALSRRAVPPVTTSAAAPRSEATVVAHATAPTSATEPVAVTTPNYPCARGISLTASLTCCHVTNMR